MTRSVTLGELASAYAGSLLDPHQGPAERRIRGDRRQATVRVLGQDIGLRTRTEVEDDRRRGMRRAVAGTQGSFVGGQPVPQPTDPRLQLLQVQLKDRSVGPVGNVATVQAGERGPQPRPLDGLPPGEFTLQVESKAVEDHLRRSVRRTAVSACRGSVLSGVRGIAASRHPC